jgi:hypothetical protein
MNWKTKLNAEERKHFVFACGDLPSATLNHFKMARDAQRKLDPVNGCCLECKFIAQKLGIEGG